MQNNKNYEPIKEAKQIMKGGNNKSHKVRNILILLIILLLVALPFMIHLYSNSKINSKLQEFASTPKGDCMISFENSRYNIWSKHLVIRNVSVTCGNEELVKINAVDISNFNKSSLNLSDFTASVIDANVMSSSSRFGKYGEALSYLGYTNLMLNGTIDIKYNPNTAEFTIKKAVLTIPTLGVVSMELAVSNIVSTSFAEAYLQILSTPYDSLWIKFTDAGLTDRVISAYAKKSLIDIIQAKQRALTAIDRRIKKEIANPIAKEQLVQLYRFLEKPSEIVLIQNKAEKSSLNTILQAMNAKTYKGIVDNITNLPVLMRNN